MRTILLLIAVLGAGQICGELVNRPVVNIYKVAEEDTEVRTQAIYGTLVEVIEERGDWSKIKTPDGVDGWLPTAQIAKNPAYERSKNVRPTQSLFSLIYRVTDTTPYPPILTLPYGSTVLLESPGDTGERWVAIELISGEKGWIQRGDVNFTPRTKTLDEMIAFSANFLGLPYTWAGTSTFGFDCSGFMQMLYHLSEISLSCAASALQQIFGLHSRLAYRQWSLAPDTKICAASLHNSNLFLINGIIQRNGGALA